MYGRPIFYGNLKLICSIERRTSDFGKKKRLWGALCRRRDKFLYITMDKIILFFKRLNAFYTS
jgi:hypothetical protein